MIRIISGTFGHLQGKKVVPITAKSGAVDLGAEQEARLVKRGVAVYVNKAETAAPAPEGPLAGNQTPPAPVDPSGSQSGSENESGQPEYNATMKLDELQEVAKAYGVDASKMRTKAEVIAAIEAAKESADNEKPPALGAAEPV